TSKKKVLFTIGYEICGVRSKREQLGELILFRNDYMKETTGNLTYVDNLETTA
ncbi:hypothetical protein L9F63_003708, partial [Diploptera punctata]